jgi:outer membrane protein W
MGVPINSWTLALGVLCVATRVSATPFVIADSGGAETSSSDRAPERQAKRGYEKTEALPEARRHADKAKDKGKGKGKKEVEPEPIVLEEEPRKEEAATKEAAVESVEQSVEADVPEQPSSEPSPTDEPEETAPAGDARDSKLYLGLRLGYGFPLGRASGDPDAELDRHYSSKLPIWLDAGYRFSPKFLVGLYGQYAIATLADDSCSDGADCSGSVIRFGLQVQYNAMPNAAVDPWFGLGIGYELAHGEGSQTKWDLRGFEFANLQAGFDFKLSAALSLGPFVSYSFGRYASGEYEPGDPPSGQVQDKALHEWVVIGLRTALHL